MTWEKVGLVVVGAKRIRRRIVRDNAALSL